MAADVEVRWRGRRAVEPAERAQAVEPHQVRLPMVGLHARGLIERHERLLVQALPDADLRQQEVRVHVVGIHPRRLLERARRVAHGAEKAPQPAIEVVELQLRVGRMRLIVVVLLAVRIDVLPVELLGHPQVVGARAVPPLSAIVRLVARIPHAVDGWVERGRWPAPAASTER